MSVLQRWVIVAAGCGLAVVLGCGGSGPGKSAVNGTVKIEGTPVDEGELTFQPKDKGKTPEGARIKNGSYSVRIAPGTYTVQVNATKKVPLAAGEVSASGEKEKLVSIVPARYEKTPPTVEITGDGEHNFNLTAR